MSSEYTAYFQFFAYEYTNSNYETSYMIGEYATFVPLLLPAFIFGTTGGQSEREPMNRHLAKFRL